jgi:hypothetical protein
MQMRSNQESLMIALGRYEVVEVDCVDGIKNVKEEIHNSIQGENIKNAEIEDFHENFFEDEENITEELEENYLVEKIEDETMQEPTTMIELEEIQDEHSLEGKIPCLVCGKFLKPNSLDSHFKRFHESTLYACDLCPKVCISKPDIISHVLCHTSLESRRKYQCTYCLKWYIKKATLEHHILMRHTQLDNDFKCECGAGFKTEMRLRYHKVIIEKKFFFLKNLIFFIFQRLTHENGSHLCLECNKTYPSLHNLRIHISHFHKSKSPCSVCGKLVAPGTFMNRHMKSHGPPSIECDVCLRKFTVRESMIEHQRSVHGMGETLFCPDCGKKFGSKKTLKRHIDRTHVKKEKAMCEVENCTYTASRRDNLINHVKIHKGLDPSERDEYIARIRAMKNLSW